MALCNKTKKIVNDKSTDTHLESEMAVGAVGKNYIFLLNFYEHGHEFSAPKI